ncbi:MAG: LysM peptidoglycan-binding domain-containing protein [Verrucomicrobiota bacterium]
MIFAVRLLRMLAALWLCMGLGGCLPSVHGDEEEEKEAHYLAGKSCLSSMDYQGAVESFEKAVEVNPRSASAHFQLGCLYEEKQPEPAAAIYHYEQYLKLRPKSDKAEFVRDRINNCKQDLAKTVMPLPIPAGMQKEFEHLAEDNKRLREDNERLRAQLENRPPTVLSNAPPSSPRFPNPAADAPPAGETVRTPPPPGSRRTVPGGKTHTVRSGETPMSIARKYGVKLDDLLRANPGLDPKRMPAGRVLNIPAS